MSWLRDYNISVDNLQKEDVIFGKSDIAENFLLFFYIYSWKCQNGIPSLQGFIARTRRIYDIELHIAKKRKFKIKLQRDKIKLQRDKLNNHFQKWEKLISVFPNK